MIKIFCLIVGLVPIIFGYYYLFKPRKMARLQTKFRKRLEKAEKRLIRAHRVTGLAYVLAGTLIIMFFVHPLFFYNIGFVYGFLSQYIFPGWLTMSSAAKSIVPTVWL